MPTTGELNQTSRICPRANDISLAAALSVFPCIALALAVWNPYYNSERHAFIAIVQSTIVFASVIVMLYFIALLSGVQFMFSIPSGSGSSVSHHASRILGLLWILAAFMGYCSLTLLILTFDSEEGSRYSWTLLLAIFIQHVLSYLSPHRRGSLVQIIIWTFLMQIPTLYFASIQLIEIPGFPSLEASTITIAVCVSGTILVSRIPQTTRPESENHSQGYHRRDSELDDRSFRKEARDPFISRHYGSVQEVS